MILSWIYELQFRKWAAVPLVPDRICNQVTHTNLSPKELTMKKSDTFYRNMQTFIAVSTVGPSALRNQGSKGVIRAAQKYLGSMDLEIFRPEDEASFSKVLDAETEKLRQALPKGAKNWGAARKALNLFLRDICYNRFLCKKYGLSKAEEWMEIPLDSLTAASLKRMGPRGNLPQWPGLNRLTPDVSSKFQTFAKQVALAEGISRIHLDMRLWTEEREEKKSNWKQFADNGGFPVRMIG
jgi:hypothetical protein